MSSVTHSPFRGNPSGAILPGECRRMRLPGGYLPWTHFRKGRKCPFSRPPATGRKGFSEDGRRPEVRKRFRNDRVRGPMNPKKTWNGRFKRRTTATSYQKRPVEGMVTTVDAREAVKKGGSEEDSGSRRPSLLPHASSAAGLNPGCGEARSPIDVGQECPQTPHQDP